MKQNQIIRAYKTLIALSEQKLPLAVGHKLWTLRKKMEPQWEFQVQKEQALITEFGPSVGTDGTVHFKSSEDEELCKEEYAKLIAEMSDLDVEWDENKKIILHLDDKIDISMEDIDALKDFVEFVE